MSHISRKKDFVVLLCSTQNIMFLPSSWRHPQESGVFPFWEGVLKPSDCKGKDQTSPNSLRAERERVLRGAGPLPPRTTVPLSRQPNSPTRPLVIFDPLPPLLTQKTPTSPEHPSTCAVTPSPAPSAPITPRVRPNSGDPHHPWPEAAASSPGSERGFSRAARARPSSTPRPSPPLPPPATLHYAPSLGPELFLDLRGPSPQGSSWGDGPSGPPTASRPLNPPSLRPKPLVQIVRNLRTSGRGLG